MTILIGTLISDAMFGYCVLSKWEFDLRKSSNPPIDYDYTWSSYYTHWFTKQRISNAFIEKAAFVFLTVSLAANIYSVI